VNLARLRTDLAERRIHIEAAESAFTGEPHLDGFRVSYAFVPPDRLARALATVGDLLRGALS
jgi:DNA-binding transcriptional MocR family regulator